MVQPKFGSFIVILLTTVIPRRLSLAGCILKGLMTDKQSSPSISTMTPSKESIVDNNDTTCNNNVKTVFLIRHAESEENRRTGCLKKAIRSFGRFELPDSKDVGAAFELLNMKEQIDSDVSEIGKSQISNMADILHESNFVTSNNIELVAHSPLIRARETSKGMLGCMAPSMVSKTVKRVVETDLLIEKTPKEWILGQSDTFTKRLSNLEKWLNDVPEQNIALVGHSQFFKALLKLDYKFGNCDVWQVKFDGKSETEKWTNLKQIFKCEMPTNNTPETTDATNS